MPEKYSLEFFDKTDDYDNIISIFQDSRWSSNICWSFRINLTFPPQCPEKNLKTAMFLQDHCWWYSCWWQSCLWERRSRRNLWGLGSHRRWSSKNSFVFLTWTMINLFILFSEAISFTGFIISSCDFNIVSRASPLSELLLNVGLSFSSSTNSLLLLWIDIFDILGRNTWQNEIKFFISHQNWYNMTIIIKIPFPCTRYERDSAVPNTTNCPVFLMTFVTKVIFPSWFIIQIFKPVNWSGGTLAYSTLYKL